DQSPPSSATSLDFFTAWHRTHWNWCSFSRRNSCRWPSLGNSLMVFSGGCIDRSSPSGTCASPARRHFVNERNRLEASLVHIPGQDHFLLSVAQRPISRNLDGVDKKQGHLALLATGKPNLSGSQDDTVAACLRALD